jgi:hypothetical protein
MSHVAYAKARSWRADVIGLWDSVIAQNVEDGHMDLMNVAFLDPLRGLVKKTNNLIDPMGAFPATAENGRQRDMMDIKRADLIVVGGLDGAPRVSIGTMIEWGMALAWNKPICLIASAGLVLSAHDHPWLRRAEFVVPSAGEAVELMRYLFTELDSEDDPEKEPEYGDDPKSGGGEKVVSLVPRRTEAQSRAASADPMVVGVGTVSHLRGPTTLSKEDDDDCA